MFNKFVLLKNLDKCQIDDILSLNDLYNLLDQSDIESLPDININNLTNICNFVDYYQLEDQDEFIFNIGCYVYEKNPVVINTIQDIPLHICRKVYEQFNEECVDQMKCEYINVPYYINDHWRKVKHVFCYKYLSKKQYIAFYNINKACQYGYLDMVKYLFEKGQICSNNGIYSACLSGHFEIIKYLITICNKEDTNKMIDYVCCGGHLDIVKYLFEVLNFDCSHNAINAASHCGYLDIVKYLVDTQHKICTVETLDNANAYVEVVRYLVEVHNIRNIQNVLRIASTNVGPGQKEVVEYLLNKKKNGILKQIKTS